MGDRGNIKLVEHDGEVWFYTHWRGSDLPEIVKDGLTRGKPRWGDAPYLNRILFDALTAGRQGDETGFGISCSFGDNEYPVVVINHERRIVTFVNRERGSTTETPLREWTFETYVATLTDKLNEAFRRE